MSKGKPYPHLCPSGQTDLSENNMAYGEESVELTLTRELAREIECQKDRDYVVISWASQKEALAYFNEHGFVETLGYMLEMRERNMQSATGMEA